jgi:hypothetical protein
MADINTRRLPVGIQSFKVIREENYLYVDKSDIVWNLVNLGQKYNYLSRPRRFGKSVLVDTLEAYLQGRKEGSVRGAEDNRDGERMEAISRRPS